MNGISRLGSNVIGEWEEDLLGGEDKMVEKVFFGLDCSSRDKLIIGEDTT
jgi:hypothetical protein